MENRIKLKVLGITYSQIQNGAYALVLAEEEGPHRIPIIIGTAEAQAIAIRLEHLVPPLYHRHHTASRLHRLCHIVAAQEKVRLLGHRGDIPARHHTRLHDRTVDKDHHRSHPRYPARDRHTANQEKRGQRVVPAAVTLPAGMPENHLSRP